MATTKYERSFVIRVVGEVTGETFVGSFTVKTRLSHRDHLNRDSLRRQLLGDKPEFASERAATSAEIFSQCSTRILEAPSWWTGSDGGMTLTDDSVVIEVYQEALKCEAEALAEVQKKAEEAKKDLAKVETSAE